MEIYSAAKLAEKLVERKGTYSVGQSALMRAGKKVDEMAQRMVAEMVPWWG